MSWHVDGNMQNRQTRGKCHDPIELSWTAMQLRAVDPYWSGIEAAIPEHPVKNDA